MKRFKKPKQKTVTLTEKDLNRLEKEYIKTLEEAKRKAVTDASAMAMMLYLVAAKDELKLSFEQLRDTYVRADRYARYLDEHLVEMKDLKENLEKDTGIKVV